MTSIQGIGPGMTTNNLTPFEPTHPGELIKSEVEYRGIKQRDLAAQMDMSYSQLNEILNGKRPVSAEIALMFEAVLGVEPMTLVNMQTRYNMQTAQKNKSLLERLAKMKNIAAM
jgi:addiction module HigA family antidote